MKIKYSCIFSYHFHIRKYFQVYRKLLPQFTHPRQVASSFVFLQSIIVIIINITINNPRICIGRTSGLVCDGVSDCIFGEDEAPELCHSSPSQTSIPERRFDYDSDECRDEKTKQTEEKKLVEGVEKLNWLTSLKS